MHGDGSGCLTQWSCMNRLLIDYIILQNGRGLPYSPTLARTPWTGVEFEPNYMLKIGRYPPNRRMTTSHSSARAGRRCGDWR